VKRQATDGSRKAFLNLSAAVEKSLAACTEAVLANLR
jgi:hypothetical protein